MQLACGDPLRYVLKNSSAQAILHPTHHRQPSSLLGQSKSGQAGQAHMSMHKSMSKHTARVAMGERKHGIYSKVWKARRLEYTVYQHVPTQTSIIRGPNLLIPTS
eukprot:1152402-Pelagomonas_calceolata.AAC.7